MRGACSTANAGCPRKLQPDHSSSYTPSECRTPTRKAKNKQTKQATELRMRRTRQHTTQTRQHTHTRTHVDPPNSQSLPPLSTTYNPSKHRQAQLP